MFQILVVEDDKNSRRLMESVLASNGYQPILAKDGLEALNVLDHKQIDLIVLDIMMPNMDGFELTRQLRQIHASLPILMVTARETAVDKKKGFLLGADDYMVKPVDEEEMILRIVALLRRSKIANEHQLSIGSVTLNYDSFTVLHHGEKNELPKKEFKLLFQLLSYPNKIFTRRQLMDEIWDMDSDTDEHTIDVHINRLRDRFKEVQEFEIVTVRGLGYKAVRKI